MTYTMLPDDAPCIAGEHYATRLTRNDVSVLHLQKLLGHARPETTERYVTLELTDLVKAARKDPRNQDETPAILTAVAS